MKYRIGSVSSMAVTGLIRGRFSFLFKKKTPFNIEVNETVMKYLLLFVTGH